MNQTIINNNNLNICNFYNIPQLCIYEETYLFKYLLNIYNYDKQDICVTPKLKMCAFYNTKNKCRHGEACLFIHSEYKKYRPSKQIRKKLQHIKQDFIDKQASVQLIVAFMRQSPYAAIICNDILPDGIHYIGSV